MDDFDEKCITFDDPAEFHLTVGDTTNLLPPNQNILIIGITIVTIMATATIDILITKKKQK